MAAKKKVQFYGQQKPSDKTVAKHVKILEQVARKNKGKLPTYTTLEKNGLFRSYEIMQMFPARFKHIERRFGR
jgi:hypothetical protein